MNLIVKIAKETFQEDVMKKLIMLGFLIAAAALVLPGCGGSNDGLSTGTIDVDSGTIIDDSGTISAPVGDLGPLTDIGDLLGSYGDNWYFTKVTALNDNGQVVGQSNNGDPVKGAFLWDPSATPAMTFLGIHSGTYDGYYDDSGDSLFRYSEAVDINNNGQVICYSTTGDETQKRAFYFDPVTYAAYDLAPITWDAIHSEWVVKQFSEAVKINEDGGILLNIDDATGRHAYYWDGVTVISDTPFPLPGIPIPDDTPYFQKIGLIINEDSEAVALNTLNQAVVNSGGTAVFTDINKGVIESLNDLPGVDNNTKAVDMNNTVTPPSDRGHIVGTSGDQAFFWDGGAMKVVGDLGGGSSEAVDINNMDQVVGNSTTTAGSTHAFLWYLNTSGTGVMRDLGTLGGDNSYAVAINDAGQVIGYSETGEIHLDTQTKVQHAFLWNNGVMYDLGTHNDFYDYGFVLPYPFSEAVAINASGQIAGNSITINAHYRGFLLTPTFP